MTQFVRQYGEHFFVLIKVQGYIHPCSFYGTRITEEEYRKLYYSSDEREMNCFKGKTAIRIKGVASEIIGREINTVE